ncbi:MAG: ankyrin repeat domain-containing protein [Puniceicoccales bacterium]|jgi:ankyrin repeat protein|nr:ankyrin repeat domain-containing protein [Puniceicoccales bacterium]
MSKSILDKKLVRRIIAISFLMGSFAGTISQVNATEDPSRVVAGDAPEESRPEVPPENGTMSEEEILRAQEGEAQPSPRVEGPPAVELPVEAEPGVEAQPDLPVGMWPIEKILEHGEFKSQEQSDLWKAVGSGDVEAVEAIFSGKSEFDCRQLLIHSVTIGNISWNPLYLAARKNDQAMINLLANRMKDLGLSFVHRLCSLFLNVDLLRDFIAFGMNPDVELYEGHTLLYHALRYSAISSESFLVLLHAYPSLEEDINRRIGGENTLLHFLAKIAYIPPQERKGIVESLLKYPEIDVNVRDSRGWTPLHWAVSDGQTETVKLLLAQPAIKVNEPGIFGETPLHVASEFGQTEVVKLLLAHPKIDVNARGPIGGTPLHIASEFWQTEVVKLLLNHSADVNALDSRGWTPLHWAVSHGQTETVRLLLAQPAIEVNRPDILGWTPLHWAARRRNFRNVYFLVGSKADINARNDAEQTPFDVAQEEGRGGLLGQINQEIQRIWEETSLGPVESERDMDERLSEEIQRLDNGSDPERQIKLKETEQKLRLLHQLLNDEIKRKERPVNVSALSLLEFDLSAEEKVRGLLKEGRKRVHLGLRRPGTKK